MGLALTNPKAVNLSYIKIGVIVGKYANIITAPNSLMPLENIKIKPERTDFFAKGRLIVKNTFVFEAPKFNAAFSKFCGTLEKPSIATIIRNGMLTYAIATAIPSGESIKLIPSEPAILPIIVSLETSPSTAIPAAECGITIGILIIPSNRLLNLKFFFEIMYANGMANIEQTKQAANETHRVKKMLD